jgi:hypothetical protein
MSLVSDDRRDDSGKEEIELLNTIFHECMEADLKSTGFDTIAFVEGPFKKIC